MEKSGFSSRRVAMVGSIAVAMLAATVSSAGATASPAGSDRGGGKSTAVAEPVPARPLDPNDPTAEETARMKAQIPLLAAANRVKVVADKYPAGFTGLALEASSVTLYWKGPVPVEIANAIDAAKGDAPVSIRSATYSSAELDAAAESLAVATKGKKDRGFHSIKIPVDGRGLILATDLGQRDKLARAKPKTTVPAEIEEALAPTMTSGAARLTPTSGPFSNTTVMRGGAAISNGPGKCSVGWSMRKNNADVLLSAGHCGGPNGGFNDGSGHYIGQWASEHTAHDEMLIQPTVPVEGSISDGGGTFLNESRPQTNWKLPVANPGGYYTGQQICQSGMVSGTICGLSVGSARNFQVCEDTPTGLLCINGLIDASRQGIAARPGDSGGPVFAGSWSMQIRSNNSYRRCVDVSPSNTQLTTLFDCNRTPAQQWVYNAGDQTIRPMAYSNKCLDADSSNIGHNGTLVQTWACNGSPQQKWTTNATEFGTAALSVEFRNTASGRCLDADTVSAAQNGSRLQLWDCTAGAAGQRFTTEAEVVPVGIVSAGAGVAFASSLNSAYCLDAARETIGNYGKVQMWACTPGAATQSWTAEPDGHIMSAFKNPVNGRPLCLDADRASLLAGNTMNVKLQLWDCTYPGEGGDPNAGNNQIFKTSNAPTMGLVAKLGNGACIDAKSSFGNGTEVHLWTCSPVAQQQWNASSTMYFQSLDKVQTDLGATIRLF